ncbi:E3 SUMO-protein ligase NSE2-like [Drosophila elegans]|uniref:E3 SUMO-protein ligase NSE2-like n=1 Tax=Drosophila elegans TaxID=30023 RepID=UPI0007E7F2A0|nr:E3 SUMO-protein ligase NSE2-like [Drosophila elegans]
MEFNQHVNAVLDTLVDNTKFFRELADVMSEFRNGGEMQKLLEESAQKRVEQAENLIKMKSKHQSLDQAMQQAKSESSTIEEFERNWKERCEAVDKKRINVGNMAEFKNFKRAVQAAAASYGSAEDTGHAANGTAAHDDDLIIEGIEETGGEIFSLYDPWSKALMKNPVRNTVCGHIYDRDSVMPLIKNNIGIRCPVLGCANRSYIHPAHLIEDAKVRAKVLQQMAEEAEVDATSEEDEDDD